MGEFSTPAQWWPGHSQLLKPEVLPRAFSISPASRPVYLLCNLKGRDLSVSVASSGPSSAVEFHKLFPVYCLQAAFSGPCRELELPGV